MTIDRDPKTISWKAAFDLIIVAEAVKVVSHNNEVTIPYCDTNDNTYEEINLHLRLSTSVELNKKDNESVSIDEDGNLWFVDKHKFHVGIRLLNASPVIVP